MDGAAMRTKVLAAVSATAALVAASVMLAVGPAGAESNGGVRIMPLGDSITDGFNVPGGYRVGLWQKLVAGGYRADFVGSGFNGPAGLGDHDHEGHSGWTIAQIDSNINGWLATYRPRTILLHIGTNDIYGSNPAGAPARLGTLLDHITAAAPNAEVFVAQITPLSCCDAGVRAFNAAIPGLVQSRVNAGKHLHLVNMYAALGLGDLADGVHPNAGGYAKMADVWYSALRSVPGSLTDGASPSPSPSSSRPASPSSSPPVSSSAPPPGACTATYRVVNSWGGGFQAEVSVANPRTSALNGWTVRMTLAGGQSIVNLWNGVASGTAGAISVQNAAYNGGVPSAGATTFGFVANGNGAAAPTAVTCSSP
jgi:lysophospholipase L1-like esterase